MDHCLSSLELIELRTGGGSVASREHVQVCRRCSALLAASTPEAVERQAEFYASLRKETEAVQRLIEDKLVARKAVDLPPKEGVPAPRSRTRTRTVLLSQFLGEIFEKGEWDRGSLAERAQIPTSLLNAFCNDIFDLTQRSDTDAVAQVLTALADDPEEIARGPLWESLLRTPGGMIDATGTPEMLAGSSFAGISEASRESALFRDQVEIDDSDPARKQAAELYLADVLAAL